MTVQLAKRLLVAALIMALFSPFLTPTAEAYSASKANAVIATGNGLLGTPYKFGATYGQTRNFDCSSFVKYVFARQGITLPRSSADQATRGTYVSLQNLQKGDLIFFKTAGSNSRKVTHVAIYAGNNQLLHTYGSGGVRYSSFSSSWKSRYITSKRVL